MSSQFIINGKAYDSVDEMPPDVRASYEAMQNLFADGNQNGIPDVMEGVMQTGGTVMQAPTIVYEGKTYTNVNDLPPEARAKYEQAIANLADRNQNGIPDVLEGAAVAGPATVSTVTNVSPARTVPNEQGQGLGPIIVLAIIAIGLAVIVAILLFLLLSRAR